MFGLTQWGLINHGRMTTMLPLGNFHDFGLSLGSSTRYFRTKRSLGNNQELFLQTQEHPGLGVGQNEIQAVDLSACWPITRLREMRGGVVGVNW